jgi:hypothetical protein
MLKQILKTFSILALLASAQAFAHDHESHQSENAQESVQEATEPKAADEAQKIVVRKPTYLAACNCSQEAIDNLKAELEAKRQAQQPATPATEETKPAAEKKQIA